MLYTKKIFFVSYEYEVRIEVYKIPKSDLHLHFHILDMHQGRQLSNLTLQRHRSSVESSLPKKGERHGALCHIEAVTRSYGTRDSTGQGVSFKATLIVFWEKRLVIPMVDYGGL